MRLVFFVGLLVMAFGCRPYGHDKKSVTFSPMCGSPGDPVKVSLSGPTARCNENPVADYVIRFGNGNLATPLASSTASGPCVIDTVVPEGAESGPISVDEDNYEHRGPNSFTIPCPDAGVDAGVDAGTTDAGTADAGTPNTDPTGDLDAVNGDPALDIVTSQSYVDMGKPWIRVTFVGAWPRPAYYSHYVKIFLRLAPSTNVASHTDQLHAGVASAMSTGIAANLVTFVPEANGFRILFNDPSLMFDSYSIECGVLKTMGGTLVRDLSGPFSFERTEKPFGS